MQQDYLETTKNVYKEAAENQQSGLGCTTTPVWQLTRLYMPADRPCVFTGTTAIYFRMDNLFDDHTGLLLLANQALVVCDKTVKALKSSNRKDIYISASNWFYDGGGCC